MIKRQFAAALLGLATTLFAATAPAQNKELLVAVDTAFIPFSFKQGNTYTGFDVEMWDAIAKELGLRYKLQPMDFNGILPGLQTRNIDVAIAGITIRPDRAKVIDFSDPYYESGLAILVRANENSITDIQSLAGKTIGVKIGTNTVDYLRDNVPQARLKLFPNIDNAFLDLATNRVDAAVHDTPNVQYYANTAGKGRVKVSGSLTSGDFYGIGLPKDSALTREVNRGLAAIRANGVYDAIYVKWFGKKP